ncbi:Transposase DDE domain-containing protein [Acinetobacter bereziniae]|uniref:Uncharacterized protein n=1 Tax=Acinetobacter bereziniae NIPH 3 TaxID=1217651 RepID=N8X6I3_ACIBZ|nr:hypothetical protein F963_04223 [Acinetobacter bereziniae NIPH 3]
MHADRTKVLELDVTQCLRWSKGIFKNICYKNSTLNHPRMNAKKIGNIRTRIKRMDETIRIFVDKISQLILPNLEFPGILAFIYLLLIPYV